MNLSLIFVIFGIVICTQYAVLSKTSSWLQIRNGEDAEEGEFPYMVQVRTADKCFYCGGSILAPRWVLTAGHCIDEFSLGQSGNYSIIYGTRELYDCYDENDEEPDTIINVKILHRHTNYSLNFISGISSYDLGILELENDIPLSDYAQPITLAEEDVNLPSKGEIGMLSGWGSFIANGAPQPILQKLQLPVLENKECSARIDYVNDGDMVKFDGIQTFCTDVEDNGQCMGDSGSPFVINGTQYGIVSWSIKPCGQFPGVLVRVALPEHRQWIKEVTGI